jgi:hypothetical protein
MSFALSFPGTSSDWIYLAAAADRNAKAADSATSDGAADAAKYWRTVAGYLADVAVKVRVLSRPQYLEVVDRYNTAKTLVERSAADDGAMRAGLVDVRGLANSGDRKVGDEELYAAIAASELHSLIADVVIEYNRLRPEERAAFFTSAPAPTDSIASIAARIRAGISAAGLTDSSSTSATATTRLELVRDT